MKAVPIDCAIVESGVRASKMISSQIAIERERARTKRQLARCVKRLARGSVCTTTWSSS